MFDTAPNAFNVVMEIFNSGHDLQVWEPQVVLMLRQVYKMQQYKMAVIFTILYYLVITDQPAFISY